MATQRDELATKKDLDELKRYLIAKMDANSATIEGNSKGIGANSAALARISHQVVENSDQRRQLLAKTDEFKEYFDEMISTLDGLASGFANLNQERAATNARLDRVENDVAKNKTDIKKIKTKLAVP